MSLISADEFLNLLRRSKIVADEPLEKALSFLRAQRRDRFPSEGPPLAEALVELGLITAWQADKLLARRYKGFFLGRFKLLDQIGTGGMSRVFLAEHLMLHRQRALKVLPRERVKDSTYLARFQLEARAIAALDHPNIVRAYDIDSVGDIHYLVMEYVAGPDLQRLVQERGPLPYDVAAGYLAQAARGLQHAHESGLIHRDVKPANLLIDEREVVKVLDLGLALFHDLADEASLTIAHQENVLGTADYLAPEQALDSHSIDHRADLYGLGCTLYFALTGAPPFPDGSIAQRIARHQSRMPPPLHSHRADCPAELEAICFRLIQKNPDDRYATAAEVADALETFADHFTSTVRQETPEFETAKARREGEPSESRLAAASDSRGRGTANLGYPVPPSRHSSGTSTDRVPGVFNRDSAYSGRSPGEWDSRNLSSGSSSSERPDRRVSKPRPNDTVSDQSAETLKGIPVVPTIAVTPMLPSTSPRRRPFWARFLAPCFRALTVRLFAHRTRRASSRRAKGGRWARLAFLLGCAVLAGGLLAFVVASGWWVS